MVFVLGIIDALNGKIASRSIDTASAKIGASNAEKNNRFETGIILDI